VGSPAQAFAARAASKSIPIVCGSCGDPVDNGLVASLARPGGNVTGLASLSAELIAKRVELLKETIPGLSRVAVLLYPGNPGTRLTLRALDVAGGALDIEAHHLEVRNAADFEKVFQLAATAGAGAVLVPDDPLSVNERTRIAELALKHRLPAVAGHTQIAEAGVMMAYGPNRIDLYRRAATLVDKILKGAKPGDLPIEQPTKFELVINLKTAKALGVAIPQMVLLRADQVIDP
jgi:putative ABC transport system substrate-binding protein